MKLKLCFLPVHIACFFISFFYTFALRIILFLLPTSYSKRLDIYRSVVVRDVRALLSAGLLVICSYYQKFFNYTAYDGFKRVLLKDPNKVCFVSGNNKWTYKMVDDYTGKVANVFNSMGYKKGDVVGIFINNCPEYVCLWLGLSRLGVISSLINVNQRGHSLKFCIRTSKCKAILFSEDLSSAILDVKLDLECSIRYFQLCGQPKEGVSNLDNFLVHASTNFTSTFRNNYRDHLVYIHTSGTTGLPKAAIIGHSRFLLMGTFSSIILNITSSDIVYIPLPLYHVAGGLLGISMCTIVGSTGVIVPKFSATNYIADCIKYKCTASMCIGEMCRYILAQPPSPNDKAHSLKMMISTGLRKSVWKKFTKRFGIEAVRELYGSTEGNIQFVNVDNTIGAVGFIPQCLPEGLRRYIGTLIRVNPETMEPLRNDKGYCIECDVDEAGMLLGMMTKNNLTRIFYGYVDAKESEKKIIRNIFQQGDEAFVTGDLMIMDKHGYLFFKDRTGDSYRWKGENVASYEVETIINKCIEPHECAVYGVQVGDYEGKAGMAAIVDPKKDLDLGLLATSLEKHLPKYAIPLFIRLMPALQFTGTFRIKKHELKNDGFNPNIVKDPLYFKQGNSYVELTNDMFNNIMNGKITV